MIMEYCIIILLLFFSFTASSAALANRDGLLPIITDINPEDNTTTHLQTYIIFLEEHPEGSEFLGDEDFEAWHKSFLPNTTLDSGEPRLVYSYRVAISGFAARLTRDEVKAMETMEGFLDAEPERPLRLYTTYTPEFLGLQGGKELKPDALWTDSSWGAGIIIGVVDTGALPTHISFHDSNVPPPPPHWRGKCDYLKFRCNNKIIGAKAYGSPSADDQKGHGTHVASIAAGSFVPNAHVLKSAKGRASGMAPRAHLAIYKKSTDLASTAKAIDDAIQDGVNIISLSSGLNDPEPLHANALMVASFSATARGILFCAAAGNGGPYKESVRNEAPWIMTVGAGTHHRRIGAILRLGNGTELIGESGYQADNYHSVPLPIINPGGIGFNGTRGCTQDSFDGVDTKGKIVFCEFGYGGVPPIEQGENVARSGGAAMILLQTFVEGFATFADAHVLPAISLNEKDIDTLISYFAAERAANHTPVATIIFKGTNFKENPAPKLSYFSARGPSLTNGGILKPDIFAPGHNILAAWPYTVGPNGSTAHTVNSSFTFQSGTSMAAPHVSGIAALIKKLHPQWSPAAIKSAMMTTAKQKDSNQKEILDQYDNEKASLNGIGAGHVNPQAARNPGLIYELGESGYLSYLCGLGYTDKQVKKFTKGRKNCSDVEAIEAEQLNYPSINIVIGKNSTKTIRRTVTNVADSGSSYKFEVKGLKGVNVKMSPQTIELKGPNAKASFNVTFSTKGQPPSKDESSQGLLTLTDRKHFVTSPLFVTFN